VDYFTERGLPCLGPTSKAAQLEGSKAFAKAFMQRHGIPTATAQVFTDATLAKAYLETVSFPIVIKADGLAAGKGVVIAPTLAAAQSTVDAMLSAHHFGTAGDQIIIEEFVRGEEVSFIVLCDGNHAVPLATSQDHKARDDGDKGPNTGGMGAYSPAPIVSPSLHQKIMDQVITPTLKGIAQEGHIFKGFLYAGLMITPDEKIYVLEYNCRFGDPETQPILMRLTSDFAQMCLATLHGKLDSTAVTWDPRPAVGVVLASMGYPDNYRKGDVIPTLNDIPSGADYKIFHAGTQLEGGRIIVTGGRVLCATAIGDTFLEAQQKAYRWAKKALWDGGFYRNDIGDRAVNNPKTPTE
jgi:phosphoribosylamine--glycine ligase